MPIYEYRRPDGSTFEIQQSFSDDALTHDPDTGVPVTRVLHPPAVHFKAKGFYNTDYGKRRRQREGEGGEGAEAGAASAESKSAGDEASSNGAGKASEKTGSDKGKGASGKPAKPVSAKD